MIPKKGRKKSFEAAIYALVPFFAHQAANTHFHQTRKQQKKPNIESVSRDEGTIKKQIYRSDALGT